MKIPKKLYFWTFEAHFELPVSAIRMSYKIFYFFALLCEQNFNINIYEF